MNRLHRLSQCTKINKTVSSSFSTQTIEQNGRENLNQLYKFSVAPMVDYTTVHFRNFSRILSKRSLLYTEMIVDKALVYNANNPEKLARLLGESNVEGTVLQLGGNDPKTLLAAARLATSYAAESSTQWASLNLNCGCPSVAAQAGTFGLALMRSPETVAEIVQHLASVGIPTTVKCRLGVLTPKEAKEMTSWDDWAAKSYVELQSFVEGVEKMGAVGVILHARGGVEVDGTKKGKGKTNGWSPSHNRRIPPLFWNYGEKLQRDFPRLHVTLNGGLGLNDAVEWSQKGLGTMLGRTILENPGILGEVDHRIFGEAHSPMTKQQALEEYFLYVQQFRDHPRMQRSLIQPLLKFLGKGFARSSGEWLSQGISAADILSRALEHLPSSLLSSPVSHVPFADSKLSIPFSLSLPSAPLSSVASQSAPPSSEINVHTMG